MFIFQLLCNYLARLKGSHYLVCITIDSYHEIHHLIYFKHIGYRYTVTIAAQLEYIIFAMNFIYF